MPDPADRLLELGLKWYRAGRIEEASELLDAARRCAETLGRPELAAEAWVQYARMTFLACDPMLAEHAFAQAARIFDELGRREQAIDARVRQAFVAYDAGDRARATRLLEAELEGATDPSVVRGMAIGYLGNIARSQNELGVAREHYARAIETLSMVREQLYRSVFEMDTAISHLLERSYDPAWRHLQRARTLSDQTTGDPLLSALITHYQALALTGLGEHELARARLATFEALPSAASDALIETHALILGLNEGASRTRATELLSELRRNAPAFEHARLTLRILRGMLGGTTDAIDRLVVLEADHKVRARGDLEIEFSAGSAEWNIFCALARHREFGPAEAVSPEALIQAGWPGERIGAESAKNRLHVALSKLRKRGLRDVLLRYPDGYALSPGLRVLRLQSESE